MPSKATLKLMEQNGISEEQAEKPAPTTEQTRAETNIFANVWGEIRDFEEVPETHRLNLNFLPEKLAGYVEAVSQYCDVDSDMCILPLLSMLSLCLQGKAVVKYPTNNHTEPINLYALTVVTPGQRKSEITKLFRFPIDEYQQKYNSDNAANITAYKDKVEFYENAIRREKANPKGSLTNIQQYRQQIDSLTPYHNKKMYLTDTTPEALARELYLHGERMGVFADENTFIEIMGGLYSKSGTNYNIVLCAYDGSPYIISRQTAENIQLYNPLLTVFSMVQDEPFFKALHNKNFSGKGLLERFLFSFPECKIGNRKFTTPNIPKQLTDDYRNTVTKLLEMPSSNKLPILQFDSKSTGYLEDYFNDIQKAEQKDGIFEGHEDYAEKQFAKVMRVAALLHLTEHDETKKINSDTTLKAIGIGLWSETQALKAFGVIGESPEIATQKYIVRKLQTLDSLEITKSDLVGRCRKYSAKEITQALVELDERSIVKYIIEEKKGRGRNHEIIKINPKIKNLKIDLF